MKYNETHYKLLYQTKYGETLKTFKAVLIITDEVLLYSSYWYTKCMSLEKRIHMLFTRFHYAA
jgi:hypothetical protein